MKGCHGLMAGLLTLMGAAPGVIACAGSEAAAQSGAPAPFEESTVRFEQNVTDGDVEIVFEAKGRGEGLNALTVTAPNGRAVIDFASRDASSLGLWQFRFESPELKDAAKLKSSYPEGSYAFKGTTVSGARLQGTATLGHRLPAAASFLRPTAGAKDVRLKGLVLAWTPVKQAAGYIVYVEQEELSLDVTARLPASATTFVVPDGFLAPDTEYVMGIGTLTKEGNASYVEASFTTAAQKQ